MEPKQVEMTPQKINESLTIMKKQANQVEGEATALRNEATMQIFNNVAQMLNALFNDKAKIEGQLIAANQRLEDIYRGYPEVKIAMDKKDAPKKSK